MTALIFLKNVELRSRRVDVLVGEGRILAIGESLAPVPDARCIEGRGHALLPGLHDHHIHLNASAAALQSVRCGPPDVSNASQLIAALHGASGTGWLRGIGYHATVAGEIDRAWLDRHGPARPVRIQHRSGRMWIMNSAALQMLDMADHSDGRILDSDGWLRDRMGSVLPDLGPVGALLASRGVVGLTEVTPRNGVEDYRRLATAGLPQRLLVMGRPELDEARPLELASRGAVKLHYHDHDLPPLEDLTAEVARAHDAGRPVASHCTTTAELMMTLSAIEEAGPMTGDRIEHASVVTPDSAEWIARLGLTVVSQPHFLTERGAAYLAEVDPDDVPYLYRLAGLKRAGIGLAAGSDAPFGGLDPWRSMEAAVNRPEGFGPDEGLSPEEALALYTGHADAPATPRVIEPGAPADLCLIDRPWADARLGLVSVNLRMTMVGGQIVYQEAG
jgi:predicted amidohydrolase YtcJ